MCIKYFLSYEEVKLIVKWRLCKCLQDTLRPILLQNLSGSKILLLWDIFLLNNQLLINLLSRIRVQQVQKLASDKDSVPVYKEHA